MNDYKVKVKIEKRAISEKTYFIQAESEDEAQDIAAFKLIKDKDLGNLVFYTSDNISITSIESSDLSKEEIEDLLAYEAKLKELE